jgi:uncharacterized protein YjbI with pentapeptide repeats
VYFSNSSFNGNIDFIGTKFHKFADFSQTTFKGDIDFTGVDFMDEADFSGSTYNGNDFNPLKG